MSRYGETFVDREKPLSHGDFRQTCDEKLWKLLSRLVPITLRGIFGDPETIFEFRKNDFI